MLNNTPNFHCELTPATAASLHDLMTAQHVHAKRVKEEEGRDAVWETCQQTIPFYLALGNYVEKHL